MPTYEYKCAACEHEWEAEQSIKDDPLKTCPACRADAAKRQISLGTGFILKGGGWYSDLYASAKGGAGSKEKLEAAVSKAADTKSDSPSAAAPSSGSSTGSGSTGSGSTGSGSSGSAAGSSGGGSSSGGSSSSSGSGSSSKQASAA